MADVTHLIRTKVPADCPARSSCGIGRTDEGSRLRNRIVSLKHYSQNWPGTHKGNDVAKMRQIPNMRIVLVQQVLREVEHLARAKLKTRLLEATEYFTEAVPGKAIGFEKDKGLFQRSKR